MPNTPTNALMIRETNGLPLVTVGSTISPERQIRPSEIAVMYGLSCQHVYYLLATGKLRGERVRERHYEAFICDIIAVAEFFESLSAGSHRRDAVEVDISTIVVDEASIARDGICDEVIDRYVTEMDEGADFAPIVVYKDIAGHLFLAEGLHRIRACERLGRNKVRAFVRPGDQRSALLCALQANAKNPLQRRSGDIKRAVEIALKSFPQKTNREIARLCRTSHTTVNKLRHFSFSKQGPTKPVSLKSPWKPCDLEHANTHYGIALVIEDTATASDTLVRVAGRLDATHAAEAALLLEYVAAGLRRMAAQSVGKIKRAA